MAVTPIGPFVMQAVLGLIIYSSTTATATENAAARTMAGGREEVGVPPFSEALPFSGAPPVYAQVGIGACSDEER